MSEPLKALELLGAELERAAERTLAGSRPAPPALPARRRRRRRLPAGRLGALAVGLALLAVAAAATAAVLLIKQGSPLPAPHAQDLRSQGIPLPGSARLAGLDAPDPASGQPPWDLRLSRTSNGETCTAVGQVVGGRLGIVGLDHVFRPLPVAAVDSCGVDTAGAPTLLGAQTFVGRTPAQARTVLSGVAGAGVRAVIVHAEGRSRRLALGPDGSFITVYAGEAEEVRPRVVIVARDGRSRTIALEQTTAFAVPDPEGGAGWTVSTEADMQSGAAPDEDCVQVTRENSQSEPGHEQLPLTPEICGHLAASPLLVQMRRFVPGEDSAPFPWGDSPSRTIVYGVATPRVRSLVLTGVGAPRRIAIDRRGGGFAAVLDGHVDPRSLALRASLSNGTHVIFRRPTDLFSSQANRPLGRQAVPAYRSPLPIKATLPPPFELPISSTRREALRDSDPDGGPEWALISWRGAPNPHVQGAGREDFLCEELAVLWRGRLLAPTATPTAATAAAGAEAGRCDPARALLRMRYALTMEAFLNDPNAYAPRPGRVVLSGLLPPGAHDPTLLGVGAPRPLPVDANDAFLVVLPGRYWDAHPRISYLLHGRRVGRLTGGSRLRQAIAYGPVRAQVRAPDPDGAAPWGFAASADCATAIGRVVEGRMASIDPGDGVLQAGGTITGSSSSCLTHDRNRQPAALRGEPVEFDMQTVERANPFAAEPRRLGQPEVEHRTLPGRTIITGVARPDVLSVTISTPSDVRTLRPEGPLHTILAVYAGFFVRGEITATVRLRDGREETERIASYLTGDYATPSVSAQIADAREQIAQMRESATGTAGAARRANPGVAALLTSHVQQLERRLRYQRAHPGLLPAE